MSPERRRKRTNMDTMSTGSNNTLEKPQGKEQRGLNWKVFGILMVGSVIGSVLIIPYLLTLERIPSLNPALLTVVTLAQVIQDLVLSAIAAAIGLGLGGRIGLGAPVLRAWLAGDAEAPRQFRASLPIAIGLGLAVGVILAILSIVTGRLVPALIPHQPISIPPPWQGFLAAIAAGIREEMWLRLGLMTFFVWLGTRPFRRDKPIPAVVWISNILAALAFGALHLPIAAAVYGSLTFAVVATVVLLNGLGGVVFGWVYWRKGLLLAMVAHFCADLVLHVIVPAIPALVK
jgi:hypothetical protein